MDELDRMFRRLVQNIRTGFPELLTRPFEVAQLYQQIIPYRLNRREMGLESAEEYELTLTKLLSGSRTLLLGDEEMQHALRAELESPNPDLTAFRAFATSMVSLAPDALRALDAQPALRPPTGPSGTPVAPRSASEQAAMAARATEEVSIGTRHAPEAAAPPKPQPAPARRTPVVQDAATAPAPQTDHGGCRYCGGSLPEGRDVVFCPHCGHNLTVQHCPACSAELEIGWKYCITCGREVA
jgi:hypothetical protein